MKAAEPESKRARSIASAVLDDGTMVEMILDPASGDTAFLRFERGEVVRVEQTQLLGIGQAVPYAPENNLIAHRVILFPSAAAQYETDAHLLAEVQAFVHRYSDLSESFEELASLYVLLSWVYDRFSVLPYLRLKGDYGTGKSRCLQVIGSLCYKPMFVSGASTVSPLFRIIDAFRGTLVLDESDFRFSDEKAEIIKILNNGNAAGFPVLRSEATPTKEFNPRAFAVFGPKVIATRRDFDDQALESRCITEVMTGLPPRSEIPLSLPDEFALDALTLRNKLLTYRFRNLRAETELVDRDPFLEARVAQVCAPLVAIAPNDSIRARVLAWARKQGSVLRSERATSVEAQLLDTLYAMRQEGAALYIRDITARFSERFGAEFDRDITARWIGLQIRKRLSLTTVKSNGNYLVPAAEASRLDLLFRRFDTGSDQVDLGTSETSQQWDPQASVLRADK